MSEWSVQSSKQKYNRTNGGGKGGHHKPRSSLWRRPAQCMSPGSGLFAHIQIVVLCGAPGSGKSTAANQLLSATDFASRRWTRVSQDELGDRRACEDLCRRALREGNSVVVDRCNFDEVQRQHWIKLGRESGRSCCISAVCLDVDPAECCNRVQSRSGHETLYGPKSHTDSVVHRVVDQLVAPSRREGFDRVVWIQSDEQLLAEIHALASHPPPESRPLNPSAVTFTPTPPHFTALVPQPSSKWVFAAGKQPSMLTEDSVLEEEIVFVPGRDPIPVSTRGPWSCPACTFLNKNSDAPVCEICATPR